MKFVKYCFLIIRLNNQLLAFAPFPMKMIFFYFFENVIMIVGIRMNQYVKHALS